MQFYLASSSPFPPALRRRLFGLCFAATHLPLLTYIGWGMITGRMAWAEFVILALASMAGMTAALLGIGALLEAIHAANGARHQPDRNVPAAQRTQSSGLPNLGDIIAQLYVAFRRAVILARARMAELDIGAHEDPLTGIANRPGFLAQLDALPSARRRGCIAIVDIDHFSQVNDLLGHEEGDRVLSEFAARLSSQIRRVDIIARWGGEEFAIFYQDSIEDEASWSLARIAERMRKEPIDGSGGQPVTFSAGISRWQGGPVDAAIEKAADALHRAKQSGRDQVQRAGRTATPGFH